MPYPNFHACRIREPNGNKTRYAKGDREHDGKKYDVIYQQKDDGAWEDQAYRYSKETWSASAARTHCGSHDGRFEAASEKDEKMETELKKTVSAIDAGGEVAAHLRDADMEPLPLGGEGAESEPVSTERKTTALKQFKLDDLGTFSALFAPFNTIDKQGDLTLPGAFGNQRVIISAYGHTSWNGALPIGKGTIHDGEEGGIVEGKLFLNTTVGRDTYVILKELGDQQEWSYALPEVDYEMREIDGRRVRILKKIKVNEVSPVLLGAGNGTRTLAVKGILPFDEQIESVVKSAEDALARFEGRVESRENRSRNPRVADIEHARVLKGQLEKLVWKFTEILKQHDEYTAVMESFGALSKSKGE